MPDRNHRGSVKEAVLQALQQYGDGGASIFAIQCQVYLRLSTATDDTVRGVILRLLREKKITRLARGRYRI